ncbi:SapB/AmfS family lanthipeptide [Streptomyces sp. NPDC057638]
MALLDLQALETPAEDSFEDATGSQVSVIVCEYSSLSVLLCTP